MPTTDEQVRAVASVIEATVVRLTRRDHPADAHELRDFADYLRAFARGADDLADELDSFWALHDAQLEQAEQDRERQNYRSRGLD
jgi:hypothetical protein